MIYAVEWPPRAQHKLEKMEKKAIKRILQKVESIREKPFQYVKKLSNADGFRLRVGDYRVLVDISKLEKKIKVLSLGHRKNIYKRDL